MYLPFFIPDASNKTMYIMRWDLKETSIFGTVSCLIGNEILISLWGLQFKSFLCIYEKAILRLFQNKWDPLVYGELQHYSKNKVRYILFVKHSETYRIEMM